MSNKEITNEGYTLLGENTLSKNGCFKVVKCWYSGWHPELEGTLVNGWTGRETEVEKNVIQSIGVIRVKNE